MRNYIIFAFILLASCSKDYNCNEPVSAEKINGTSHVSINDSLILKGDFILNNDSMWLVRNKDFCPSSKILFAVFNDEVKKFKVSKDSCMKHSFIPLGDAKFVSRYDLKSIMTDVYYSFEDVEKVGLNNFYSFLHSTDFAIADAPTPGGKRNIIHYVFRDDGELVCVELLDYNKQLPFYYLIKK